VAVTSLLFFISALSAALVFRRMPQKARLPWLLLISAAFLAAWNWQFVVVLALFGLVNYWLGLKVEKAASSSKPWWKIAGILFNILVLFIFKYNRFFLPSLLKVFHADEAGSALQILLPVGLSFLVVQMISYLLDVNAGRLKAEQDLVKFGVYTLYFPKLLSGPVERARLFLPRLDAPLPFDKALLYRSLSLIVIGLLRKLVFADSLFSMIPADAFTTPANYAGQHLVLYLLAYAFALFNDFAGYTFIVRGVSLWFGIELANNFNLPYFSRNFTEFWNRWHISLSNWLRDYIFFPVSRALMKRHPSREHFLNILVPPLVTMLVSGMWHGLGWNLLVWGGLHGIYQIIERLPGLYRPSAPLDQRPWYRNLGGIVVTFILTLLAWLPFRMPLQTAWAYLQGMFTWIRPDFFLFKRYITADAPWLSWSPLNLPNPLLLMLLALALGFDLLLRTKSGEKELWALPRWVQVLLIVVLMAALLASLFVENTAPFVYQAF
jgi:D-alanyl-lipoteichoic acid acyltransferase DltB (MBOAT superfamily)